MIHIANIYAQSLFEVAIEDKKLDGIYQSFVLMSECFDDSFVKLLVSPLISLREKKIILKKIVDDDLLFEFMLVLINRSVMCLFGDVFRYFCDLYDNYKNILRVEIISAENISEYVKDKIKKIISVKYCADVVVGNVIDRELIGGFVIKTKDFLIDLSVKSELDKLKSILISRKL